MIVSPFVKLYVRCRAKKLGVAYPGSLKKCLQGALEECRTPEETGEGMLPDEDALPETRGELALPGEDALPEARGKLALPGEHALPETRGELALPGEHVLPGEGVLPCERALPCEKIAFLWLWDCRGCVPNASATIPGVILLNAQWAAHIALFREDPDMHLAFRQTIGHEITHQEHDFWYFDPYSRNGRFVYWVNEVHADFGSAVKAFGGDRALTVRAMEYKKRCKRKKDRDGYSHPAWARRIAFIRECDFTEELIRQIAELTDCRYEELIQKVIRHFEPIRLGAR